MNFRFRTTALAVLSGVATMACLAPSANASLLSLLPGSCGKQPASEPFAQWGDSASYTPVPGGNFETGGLGWLLTGGARVVAGNESYDVAGGSDSLALPSGSSATSPVSCTNLFHPTARFFMRNTGSPSSVLDVQALYPGLLGGISTASIGQLTGSSSWQPSPAMSLLASNLLATVSLDQTVIAFRFVPADSQGNWTIDDVYLDPFKRR